MGIAKRKDSKQKVMEGTKERKGNQVTGSLVSSRRERV
jgi:hypothetical protein